MDLSFHRSKPVRVFQSPHRTSPNVWKTHPLPAAKELHARGTDRRSYPFETTQEKDCAKLFEGSRWLNWNRGNG